MSLITPTTQEISDNIIAQLESAFGDTIPFLPKMFQRVLAKVIAGVFVTLYKYVGFMFLQMFVATASFDETTVNGKKIRPLVEWGRLIGVGDPGAGTAAELTTQITVESLPGGTLQAGSQLTNNSNGVTYLTSGAVTLDAATVEVDIIATADQAGGSGVGSVGNLEIGAVVSFVSPLSTVNRDTVVSVQLVAGADPESESAYRQRVVTRWQQVPQGGAYADYKIWGEEVTGIINVYSYTGVPGEVDVYAEATVASSGDPDGIPTAGQLTAVEDSINFDIDGVPSRRPANAFVNVFGITRTAFDVTVTDLVVADQAQVELELTSSIETFFLNAEPFIDGLTILPRKDNITRNALIGLVADIVNAVNGTFTTVTFEENGNPGPLESYPLGNGEKAKALSVTYAP